MVDLRIVQWSKAIFFDIEHVVQISRGCSETYV